MDVILVTEMLLSYFRLQHILQDATWTLDYKEGYVRLREESTTGQACAHGYPSLLH
jgi:hypothetical protein